MALVGSQQNQIPDGFATIRRSKGRRRMRTSSTSSSEYQQEMIDMSSKNPTNRKYDSDILYNNHENDIFDVENDGETDEGVLNSNNNNNNNNNYNYNNNHNHSGEDYYVKNGSGTTSNLGYYSDISKRTFQTFKPSVRDNSNTHVTGKVDVNGSQKDLRQPNDYFNSLPYDIIMSPLKSPQYINQLNAMRSKTSIPDVTVQKQQHQQQQCPLYARPDSPKYGKLYYNRSTSPSADSMDNCSSNSSTYSTNHVIYKPPNISTSMLHQHHDDDHLIMINVNDNSRKPPLRATSLSYRKSFSHINRTHHNSNELNNGGNRKQYNGNFINQNKIYETNSSEFINDYEKPAISTLSMTKSFAMPSVSTSQLYSRRFATLAHPKEKIHALNNKSTSSLNDNHLKQHWDPILDCKIGSQSTLRTKPAVPWYELAIKKENRQSCPPMQAHVVQAFEQSLGNMTSRLQHLTATTEKKESEITEMRQTIELLKKQSIQAGLTSAHIQSMGNGNKIPASPSKIKKQQQQQQQQQEEVNGHNDVENGNGLLRRQNSSESISSLNSAISNYSTYDKKKKKGWLRSSFTKAFSRNAKISKINRQMSLPSNHSDMKISLPPPTPQHQTNLDCGKPPTSPTKQPRFPPVFDNSKVTEKTDEHGHPIVDDLKKQLREKDLVLTDIRLESLTQASQMENLKETVRSMRHEMMTLKQNNERLQKMVTTRSLAGSDGSLGCPASPSGSMDSKRYSLVPESNMQRSPRDVQRDHDETDDDFPPAPAPLSAPLSPSIIADLLPAIDRISISNEILTMAAEDVADPIDGKKIEIAVYHGHSETFQEFSESFTDCDYINGNHETANFNSISETIIANTYISGKTTWQNLDYIVRKTFKDFVGRIDPGTNLGLNTDSIISYHLGEAKRGPEMTLPEFLPCGYIIGDIKKLYICLQGVGSLAFESLIPRSIVHRYINLLTEHRRLILCGPSGTGKSYLARKLAEFMVVRSNRSPADSIATFNVDQDSSKDLQQYLSHIVEQATLCQSSEELPLVIILDNLHHIPALGEVFSGLLNVSASVNLPCIIGTMSQATTNTSNLQLHYNFRWVLTANHMEPVKGFLGRYLKRRLHQLELQTHSPQLQMEKVFKWLPTVWQHINSFLETHSSSDVTIGPQLFLSCPLDVNESQSWFADLWNYHLIPYLVETIREGVQLYGKRGATWQDPCSFIRETYPWKIGPNSVPSLRQINAEEIGFKDGIAGSNDNQDPLLNMLMRLQEAASYNDNPEDSDGSLDSQLTHDTHDS